MIVSKYQLKGLVVFEKKKNIWGKAKHYMMGVRCRPGVGTTNDIAVCNAPTEGKKAAINLPCDTIGKNKVFQTQKMLDNYGLRLMQI